MLLHVDLPLLGSSLYAAIIGPAPLGPAPIGSPTRQRRKPAIATDGCVV
jgi:hypothetical protein